MCPLTRFQHYGRLQRVIGYRIRFKDIYVNKKVITGPLTLKELQRADYSIVRMVQKEMLPSELKNLKTKNGIDENSKLIQLTPYLDKKGIIRMGDRIRKAEVTFDQKHPFILPSRHHVTTLIHRQEHLRLLHCLVRHRYWPLSGRREARKITQKCVSSFRLKPKTLDIMMADLPKNRLTENLRPFTKTGIDYAGPIIIKESRRRGRVHTSKAYIAVFICLNLKAIHLELVSDLTSEAFIAALTRFISRRSICNESNLDNGTTFVGADRELKEMYDFVKNHEKQIHADIAAKKIQWKFISPRASHFGGL